LKRISAACTARLETSASAAIRVRIEVLFYGTVERLLALITGQDVNVPLDRAALGLATIEFPGLDIGACLAILDSYATELEVRLDGATSGADYIREANQYLFQELGFTGNAQDYYSPRNSCLNEVLTARTGIPITLSLVYMEIGRRLGKPIHGVGLPGHFIVSYDDGLSTVFIDPFHGGRLLSAGECFALARGASGLEIEPDARLLEPVGKPQILLRMLHNLHRAYLSRGLTAKAIEVADLLVRINPRSAEEYRRRALLHLHEHNMAAARDDLSRYLALAPDAADRAKIEEHLRKIHRWLASLN
jgi:regulator of sirC expression with transglutaminase-like and TPR domain